MRAFDRLRGEKSREEIVRRRTTRTSFGGEELDEHRRRRGRTRPREQTGNRGKRDEQSDPSLHKRLIVAARGFNPSNERERGIWIELTRRPNSNSARLHNSLRLLAIRPVRRGLVQRANWHTDC